MEDIGPVQLLNIGFDAGAKFEGRIVDELAKLESERTIRVLDVLFIARDADSEETVVMEHPHGADLGAVVGALLGVDLDVERSEHSFGFTPEDIKEMAEGLGPGEAAGLLLVEHVWARDLRRAFRDAGARMLGDGFLTEETIRAVEPQLAAISDAVTATEHGNPT